MTDTPKNHYVYMLRCSDNSLYTGWTTDPEKRLKTHNKGKGSASIRGRLPAAMVHLEVFQDKGEALRREAAIKKLSKAEKEALVGSED